MAKCARVSIAPAIQHPSTFGDASMAEMMGFEPTAFTLTRYRSNQAELHLHLCYLRAGIITHTNSPSTVPIITKATIIAAKQNNVAIALAVNITKFSMYTSYLYFCITLFITVTKWLTIP